MDHLKIFLIGIFLSLSYLEANDNFYQKIEVGEVSQEDFSGPLHPSFIFEGGERKIKFKDQLYFDDFFINDGSREFFRLYSFMNETLPSQYLCPNQSLAENVDYALYLYRLIHLSFLYESLKLNSSLLLILEGQDSVCSPNWDKMFKSCRPGGEEMSKFLARSKDFLQLNPMKLKRYEEYLASDNISAELKSPKNPYQRFFSHEYETYCEGSSCDYSKTQLISSFKEACQEKYKIIKNICSEEDEYFTLSTEPKMTELIYLSNASVVINQKGYGRGCLDRLSMLYRHRELDAPYLKKSFSDIADILQLEKRAYIQGDLFLPGALKEFDDKGLVSFLFAPQRANDLDIFNQPSIPVVSVKSLDAQNVDLVETAKKSKTESHYKDKNSYFQTQVERRKEFAVQSLEIDMGLFDKDFEFSPAAIKNLSQSLAKFQTQRAIQDMKVHDKIGSLDRPLSLLYLKFLVNSGEHQSLFNLTYIVGNDFYIENDIDRKKEAVHISLKNDYRNKFGWQIYIIAP